MEIDSGTYILRKTGTMPDGSFNVDYAYVHVQGYAELMKMFKYHDEIMKMEGLTKREITCDMKLVSPSFKM